MKRLFYIGLATLCIGTLTHTQSLSRPFGNDSLFAQYLVVGWERFFSIKGKLPEGFIVLKTRDPLKVPPIKYRDVEGQKKGQYDFHFLQSSDENCLLLYPIVPQADFAGERGPSQRIAKRLKAALGVTSNTDSTFVFKDEVTTVIGKFVRETFNADSIHYYDIPLKQPFEEKYTHCTGMVVTKAGRASLYFRWYFTEEGKKMEQEYIQQLNGALWFDQDWRLQIEADQALAAE